MKKPGSGLRSVSGPCATVGEAVAAGLAEQGGGEVHRAARRVALVDLQLAVEPVIADAAVEREDAVDLDLLARAVAQRDGDPVAARRRAAPR